jgi:hypothetical protein
VGPPRVDTLPWQWDDAAQGWPPAGHRGSRRWRVEPDVVLVCASTYCHRNLLGQGEPVRYLKFTPVLLVVLLYGGCVPASPPAGATISAQQSNITITVDRGPNSTYVVGEVMTICATPAFTRDNTDVVYSVGITRIVADGSPTVLFEDFVPAGQQHCITQSVRSSSNTVTFTAQLLVQGASSPNPDPPQVVATASVAVFFIQL